MNFRDFLKQGDEPAKPDADPAKTDEGGTPEDKEPEKGEDKE